MLRLALLIATVAGLLAPGGSAREPSTLLQASASFQRLGDFWISNDPSYAGALDGLGKASSCRLVNGNPAHAVANWYGLGVRATLVTYALVPAGETGCTEDVPFVVELRDGGPGVTVRR